MQKEILIEKTGNTDILPIFAGHEKCAPSYAYGPHTREYYIIHFCLKGSGVLFDKFGKHTVRAGELFVIRPDEITTYQADASTPWEYSWIAFYGNAANVFNGNASVYPSPENVGMEIKEFVHLGETSPAIFTSIIYKLIYHLFSEKSPKQGFAEKVKQYIIFNYMNDITVESISNFFGFERSYLYRIFKKETSLSVKDFITKVRMNQAKKLLSKGYSVRNTAYAVGYKDQFNFSKAFKKYCETSPQQQKTVGKEVSDHPF